MKFYESKILPQKAVSDGHQDNALLLEISL